MKYKNKQSGDISAEKLDLMKARDIALKSNISEKKKLIETKLSDTTRREASEQRRSGNEEDAVKRADESIKYDLNNPWAYVEGIINSEESEKHDGAINYAGGLDELNLTPKATTDFPLDTQTTNEYKNYAINFNNEGTAIAKTAEGKYNIVDSINAVNKVSEYPIEALLISETLDTAGAEDTPTRTIVGNLVSVSNNLIVLQTQAGEFNAAKNASSATLKIIEKYNNSVSDLTKSGVLSNTATVNALSGDYRTAIDYAKRSLSLNPKNAGANSVISSSLTAVGGKKNVNDALEYAQNAVKIDPSNKIYADNLNTIRDAIKNNNWYGINLNFGVNVFGLSENLITCCIPYSCTMTTVEECISSG